MNFVTILLGALAGLNLASGIVIINCFLHLLVAGYCAYVALSD